MINRKVHLMVSIEIDNWKKLHEFKGKNTNENVAMKWHVGMC